jgi:hypothetical protein
VLSIKRSTVDGDTTWESRRVSQNSALPESVVMKRAELSPALHAAQHEVPYGVRICKRFGRKLEFGHVVAGSPSDGTSPALFTVTLKINRNFFKFNFSVAGAGGVRRWRRRGCGYSSAE